MNKIRLAAALSTFLCFDTQAVTLWESITAALANNAGWLAQQAAKNAEEAGMDQAIMELLPVVGVDLTRQWQTSPVQFAPNHWENVRQSQTQVKLQAQQNVFKGFQDVNNINSKRNTYKAALEAAYKAEQELIVKVVSAYTLIWAEREKLKAHKQKEANLKKLREAQEICLAAGTATPADVAEADSKYQTAVYERVEAEMRVVTAEAEFTQLTGLVADNDIDISNLSSLFPLPKDLNQLQKTAMACNHEILAARYTRDAALDELKVAKGRLGPTCNVIATTGRSIDGRVEGRSPSFHEVQIGVSLPLLNVPLYSNIRQYSEKAKREEFNMQGKMTEVTKDCAVTHSTYLKAKASKKSCRSAFKSAKITSQNNVNQVTFGVKSITEFLEGENALLNASNNLTTAIKEEVDALIQIVALTGHLNQEIMSKACQALNKSKQKKSISRAVQEKLKPVKKKLK